MSEFDASGLSEISRIFNKTSSLEPRKNPLETNNSAISYSRRLGLGAVKKKVISKEDSATLDKLLKIGRRKRKLMNESDVSSSEDETSDDDEDRIESRTALHSKKKHQNRIVGNLTNVKKQKKNGKVEQNCNKKVALQINQPNKNDQKSTIKRKPEPNPLRIDSNAGNQLEQKIPNNNKRKKKKRKRGKNKSQSLNTM